MIFELIKPFHNDPKNVYFKCTGSKNTYPSNDAWDMWDMLAIAFPHYSSNVVNADGFENCLQIAKQSTPPNHSRIS